MFNVGGGELLVILLLALIVLGPQKLPEVARQVGGMMRELRKVSSGFQDEMRAAMDDPIEAAARDRGRKVTSTEQKAHPDDDDDDLDDDDLDDDDEPDDDLDDDDDDGEPLISTAEAAGMYDIQRRADATEDAGDDQPEPETAAEPLSDAEAAGIYDAAPADGDQR
ncbi:MAG: Sec-independent protein translocase protein TatB [Actinomycetota bacterium]